MGFHIHHMGWVLSVCSRTIYTSFGSWTIHTSHELCIWYHMGYHIHHMGWVVVIWYPKWCHTYPHDIPCDIRMPISDIPCDIRMLIPCDIRMLIPYDIRMPVSHVISVCLWAALLWGFIPEYRAAKSLCKIITWDADMGWLRWVGSLKLQVSLAKEPY